MSWLVVGSKGVPVLRLEVSEVAESVEVNGAAGQGTMAPQETKGGVALEQATVAGTRSMGAALRMSWR